MSALVIGAGLGYMFAWTGDLGGPIAAHFTINYLNLHFIRNVELPTEETDTLASSAGEPESQETSESPATERENA